MKSARFELNVKSQKKCNEAFSLQRANVSANLAPYNRDDEICNNRFFIGLKGTKDIGRKQKTYSSDYYPMKIMVTLTTMAGALSSPDLAQNSTVYLNHARLSSTSQ